MNGCAGNNCAGGGANANPTGGGWNAGVKGGVPRLNGDYSGGQDYQIKFPNQNNGGGRALVEEKEADKVGIVIFG